MHELNEWTRETRDLSKATTLGERESSLENLATRVKKTPRNHSVLYFTGKFRREFRRSFRECGTPSKERAMTLPTIRRNPPLSSDEYTRGYRMSLRNRPF